MGFLSGIVHAIGSGIGDVEDFFSGDNKKKQPQQSSPAPQQNNNQNQQNNQGNNYQSSSNGYQQVQNTLNQSLNQAQGQPSNNINLTPLDPNSLVKANPQPPTTTETSTAAPAQHASIWHDLTHNDITNAVASPFRPLGAGIARLLPGGQNDIAAAQAAVAQNAKDTALYASLHKSGAMPTSVYQAALAGQDQDAINQGQVADAIGKTADRSQVVGSALATATAPFLGAADIGESLLAKAGAGVGVGALEGANNELTSAANPTIKGALQQGAIGGITGGLLPVAGAGAGRLIKAALPSVDDAIAPITNEVATGVKSVNPTQIEDTASQVSPAELQSAQTVTQPVTGPNGEEVPQISHEAPNAKAPQIQGPSVQPDQPPAEPVQPDAMHSSETEMLNNLDTKAKTAALTPAEQNVRALLQNKQDLIDKANAPIEPAVSAPQPDQSPQDIAPTPNTSQQTLEDRKITQPPQSGQEPLSATPSEASPPGGLSAPNNTVEDSSLPSSVAQPTDNVNPEGRTAPNAPNVRKGLNKTLDAEARASGDPTTRNVLSRSELNQAAEKVVNNTPQDELLNKYSGVPDLHATADLAHAKASMPVLSNIVKEATASGDTATASAAKQAIDNIMEGSEKSVSGAGDAMNYAQSMYDSLPKEAKVSLTIRTLNKARASGRLPLIGENADGSVNLADRAQVEANLDKFIGKDEELQTGLSRATSTLEKGGDAATRSDVATQDLQDAYNAKKALQIERQKNAGDYTDYYKTLIPKNTSISQSLADWQRTAMLSSPTGRINALGGTGLTTGDAALKQSVSGVLGKIHNAIVTDSSKAVADTGMDASSLGKGLKQGLSKTKGIIQGQSYAENPDAIMNGSTARNALSELPNNSKGGVFTRLVKAATAAHQNLTAGVEDSELLRQARAAGLKEGLSGDDLDKYTLSHAGNPEQAIATKAQEMHDTMNNLNYNPVTKVLSGLANNILAKIPGIGPLVKNQIMPFSHFLGGNIWNSVTDRNVVAAGTKLVASALKGDTQGVMDNFAKTTVEGGKAYALGYFLTQHGVITNKDAQGNNYSGTYVHIGNRFIPASSFGAFGPSIILGNAAYNGFHSHNASKGDIVSHLADTVGKTVQNAYRAYSAQDLLTGGSSLPAINQAFGGKAGYNWGGVEKLGGNITGQFIPAATGDVNAVLNNGLGPIPAFHNPTHEAANTTVINPNSPSGKAKDAGRGAIAGLLNKIPIASQFLPRESGVAAADLGDRLTKGDRATGAEELQAAQQQSQADQIASYAQNPNKTLDPLNTSGAIIKAVEAANKKTFIASGKSQDTINGIVYQKNAKGGVTSSTQADYNSATGDGGPNSVQRGIDMEQFKQSGKPMDTINGIVYQRADDGTVKAMEQKDYAYKNADTGMTEAKSSGDYTGYQSHSSDLLKNISEQLQNPHLSSTQIDALTNKAMAVQKQSAEYDAYNGFTKPPKADTFKGVGTLRGAKDGYVQQIQRNAAKYNLDGNALLAVSAMEGLGGGVGDGGHAFGPFQMNDAGGVLTGKYPTSQAAQAYAESPAGIEDAVRQISKVASGLKGQAAINAIVNSFERPADPGKEIQGALDIYNGGDATLSNNGAGAAVTEPLSSSSSKAASAASKLIKDNTIGSTPNLTAASLGKLAPAKVTTSVPILQKIIPSDLVKMRSISVAKARA